MSNKLDELIENEVSVDLDKREFISKFGKYTAVSVGMATLMTPTLSTAKNYSASAGCNNGWGNDDQCAPGNSLTHNQAENTIPLGTPAKNDVHGVSDPLNTDPDGKPYNK